MKQAQTIHSIDNSISEKLTIEHFYSEVDSKKFIDDLSSTIVTDARKDYKKFVAKPFIRKFEYALDTLQTLQNTVKTRIVELETATSVAEKEHDKHLTNLNNSFKEVQISSKSLESQIGEVGNTAIRIGQQLESIDKQRSRLLQARDLFSFFLEFSQHGQCNQLEEMRSVQGPDGQYKAAIIARKLSNISKEIDFPGMEKTRITIEKYNENLEQDLLETFDQAYTNGDISTMASCSKTLLDFNGGNSCMQAYINQHEFFMSQRKLRESSIELAKHSLETQQSQINNPKYPPPPPDPWMVKLYSEVRGVVAKEWDIISKVFPNALFVIRQFLERIFNQSIDQYLEGLLDKAEQKSPLAYLRTLSSTHSCTANLVSDLKQFDRHFIYPYLQKKNRTTNKKEDRNSTYGIERYTEVSNTAERWLEEFFVPKGYLELEQNYIKNILPTLIEPYFLKRSKSIENNKAQVKPSMFARLAKAADMVNSNSNSPISGTQNLNHQNNLGYNNNEENFNGKNGNIDNSSTIGLIDIVINILNIHGEAMGRCAELAPASDLHSYSNKLFAILIDFLSGKFLESILHRSLNEIQHRDYRQFNIEETKHSFELAEQINHIMQLIQKHFEFSVLPLVSSSPPSYREVVVKKNSLMSILENSINNILHEETSQILKWISVTLNSQNRLTYKIPEDAVDLEMLSMPTETCRKCVDVLKKVFQAAKLHFEGANLKSYYVELGTGVHSLLLEHFKKFTVSPNGGMLLFLDISQYQGLIRDLKVEELTSRFEILKEIADLLFMDNPASIPSLLRSGMLANLDISSIYPYLKCRQDFFEADLPRLLGIRREDFNLQTENKTRPISNGNSLDDNNMHYVTATASIGPMPSLGGSSSSLGISGLTFNAPSPK
ncbi:exocyst complex component Sec10 [Neoconidiobolus thromboides FSU 785]|nr:exocyst complex component Sec10 [Neoconidiobolus thromboides FSU 785]